MRPSCRSAAFFLGLFAFVAAGPQVQTAVGETPAAPPARKIPADWRFGAAAWTFRDVTFLEAIERTAGLGLKHIEAFESQKVAPDLDKAVTMGKDLPDEVVARIRAALDKAGVTLTSIYIGKVPGEPAACRAVFERARKLGAGMIVSEPASGDLAAIEKVCDEYGIDLALHNHPTEKSEYRDPAFVAEVCKGRGPRIGVCCDTGHWQRRGIDPIVGLKTVEGRIFSLHLKDLNEPSRDGYDVPWGTGQGRIADVLAELKRQQVDPRIIALEYENNLGWSGPELARCVAFYRRTLAEWEKTGPLSVGWASADITPDRPTAIMGQMHLRISTGVRDPISCTALALETVHDGRSTDQAVLVSCDLAYISPQIVDAVESQAASIAERAAGLDPSKIVLNATHSHTSPVTEEGRYEIPKNGVMQPAEYQAFLAKRIADAVVEAWNARKPASVSWALSHAAVARNRRAVYFDPKTGLPAAGRTTMYGATNVNDFDSIEGPADTALPLVFFWKADGQLSGMIINLPCPSQETEHLHEISADFWHEARLELRKRFGKDLAVLPQCAAGGDCVSRGIWRREAEAEMRRRRGVSGREEVARRIANAVSDAMPVARQGETKTPVLRHTIRTLDLPMQLVTRDEREKCRVAAEKAPPESMGRPWNQNVVDRFDMQQKVLAAGGTPTTAVRVHAVRLGDVAFVTNPFEMFVDYGTRIQARSPAVVTCVVQLAGRGTPSYLPTARAVEGGGYSAVIQSMQVGPAGGRMLVDESVATLTELWSSPPTTAAAR
jgi:sugar phosphate isomerase/epimerase